MINLVSPIIEPTSYIKKSPKLTVKKKKKLKTILDKLSLYNSIIKYGLSL